MPEISKQQKVHDLLKERILSGFYPAGSRFPVEREFAGECGVSFITLRAALGRLAEEGLIDRLPGRGTFVRDRGKSIRRILVALTHCSTPSALGFFDRELVRGILDECYTQGFEPVICGLEKIHEYMVRVRNGEFAGVIFDRPDSEVALRYLRQLQKSGIPCVSCTRDVPAGAQVQMDQVGDMQNLMRTLNNFGHRRIFLVDFHASHPVFQQRHRAFLDHLIQNGTEDAETYGILAEGVPSLKTLCRRWESCPGVTALIFGCACHSLIREFLEQQKLRVPEDLSVIQWGECSREDLESGPFSVFTEARPEIGAEAVKLIARQLAGKRVPRTTLVHGKLVLRGSVAAPNRRDERYPYPLSDKSDKSDRSDSCDNHAKCINVCVNVLERIENNPYERKTK